MKYDLDQVFFSHDCSGMKHWPSELAVNVIFTASTA
jgi:hypothetical protein